MYSSYEKAADNLEAKTVRQENRCKWKLNQSNQHKHKQNNTTINILLQNSGNEGKGWVEIV